MARFDGNMEGELLPVLLTTLLVLKDPAGFLNESWRDVLAVAGVSATVIGFAIAIWRIWGAASSAEVASEAATSAREAVSRNLRLADLGSAVRLINEIHALLKSRKLDATALRLNDLRELLVQLRATGGHSPDADRQFQNTVAQVSSLEKSLYREHYGSGKSVEPSQIHSRLAEISDFLQGLATTARLETGGRDAHPSSL